MEYFQDAPPCKSTGPCCDVCEKEVVLGDRRKEMEIVLKTVNVTDKIGEKKVNHLWCRAYSEVIVVILSVSVGESL